MSSGMIAAVESERLGSMFTFFVIALVIVAPFGWRQFRAVRRARLAAAEATGAANGDTPTGLDAVVTPSPDLEQRDVARVVAAIDAAATELATDPAGVRSVDVPDQLLMGGRAAPSEITDRLIADAARRNGLSITWGPSSAGRSAEVRRRPG